MTQCVKCEQLAQCQRDMAKAELRARKAEAEVERLRTALSYAGKRCEEVHHPKKYQHGLGEPCPVEALIEKAQQQGCGL